VPSVWRLATDWTAKGLEFESWWDKIFLLSTSSRLVVRPTQPSIRWLSVPLSWGVKQLRCKDDHSYPISAEVKSTSTPNTYSWHSVSLVKHRDNLNFNEMLDHESK
jgi:hypothetical protein